MYLRQQHTCIKDYASLDSDNINKLYYNIYRKEHSLSLYLKTCSTLKFLPIRRKKKTLEYIKPPRISPLNGFFALIFQGAKKCLE